MDNAELNFSSRIETVIASGKPFSPSTQAIRRSWTPRFFSSVRICSQNARSLSLLHPPEGARATGHLAKWTSATTIGDSVVTESAGQIGILRWMSCVSMRHG